MNLPKAQNENKVSSAWHERAEALAAWTDCRLINRRDAYGSYHNSGQITRHGTINRALLTRHFRATGPRDIIGLHSADADNRGRWPALDIDQHGDDPKRAEANLYAAVWWYRRLTGMGFHPLLTESNGAGGYHLRILLTEAIDAAILYDFVNWLTSDYRRAGMSHQPERFPKQRDVRRCLKRLGNWLRLPGRHHRREYWSRVWDGADWLSGHDAIDFMLSLTGDSPALLPDIPTRAPSPQPRTYHAPLTSGNLSNRIANYMRRLPNLGVGEGRDNIGYGFACFLVRDLAVADSIALEWLEMWDRGNSPPKGRERLAEILKSAHAYGQHAIGCGLAPEQPRYDRRGHLILRARGEVR